MALLKLENDEIGKNLEILNLLLSKEETSVKRFAILNEILLDEFRIAFPNLRRINSNFKIDDADPEDFMVNISVGAKGDFLSALRSGQFTR